MPIMTGRVTGKVGLRGWSILTLRSDRTRRNGFRRLRGLSSNSLIFTSVFTKCRRLVISARRSNYKCPRDFRLLCKKVSEAEPIVFAPPFSHSNPVISLHSKARGRGRDQRCPPHFFAAVLLVAAAICAEPALLPLVVTNRNIYRLTQRVAGEFLFSFSNLCTLFHNKVGGFPAPPTR